MRKLGFIFFSLSLLAAFTLGFHPAVAWAVPNPKNAANGYAAGEQQLIFEWTPSIPEGITMRVADGPAHMLAQATERPSDKPARTAPPQRRAARPGDALYKAGMWMVIGGGSALVLGVVGVTLAVVFCREVGGLTCDAGVAVGVLGVIFALIGGLVMIAGIPVWIVGAAKRMQPARTFKQDPFDPFQQRAQAQRNRHLPPAQSVAGYTFSF